MLLTRARLSLAAVAENRGKWDEARELYEAIKNDEKAILAFKDQATVRLAQLPNLQNKPYIAPTTAPTTAPAATNPVELQPGWTTYPPPATTLPTTQEVPATLPAQ